MPIEVVKWYTRPMAKKRPEVLFVFGDNLQQTGFGGQAAAMRGEPNAVGIPTKVSPSQYFSDADYDIAKPVIEASYRRLAAHMNHGGTVVWPEDGVGTGLARLQEKSPKIWALIEQYTKALMGLSEQYDSLVAKNNTSTYTGVKEIWSGAQSGADQAGLLAALDLGLKMGGWMPKGWLCYVRKPNGDWVVGSRPDFAKLGLREDSSAGWTSRTKRNVRDTDGTLIVGNVESPGCRLTIKTAKAESKPYFQVVWAAGEEFPGDRIEPFLAWLEDNGIRRLNVAGNREHTQVGISKVTYQFLVQALGRSSGDIMARVRKNAGYAQQSDAITSFVGGYNYLSNFFEVPFVFDDKVWPSVEHCYQANMSGTRTQYERIRNTPTARGVYNLVKSWLKKGETFHIYDPEQKKTAYFLMLSIQEAKFTQNPKLAKQLVQTGNREIIPSDEEVGPLWGIKDGFGENLLGDILMDIRYRLSRKILRMADDLDSGVEDTSLGVITSFEGPFAFLSNDFPFPIEEEGEVYESISAALEGYRLHTLEVKRQGLMRLKAAIAQSRAEHPKDTTEQRKKREKPIYAEFSPPDTWDHDYARNRDILLKTYLHRKFSTEPFYTQLVNLGRSPIRVTDYNLRPTVRIINEMRLLLPLENKKSKTKPDREYLSVDWSELTMEHVRTFIDSIKPKLSGHGIAPPYEEYDTLQEGLEDYIRVLKQYKQKVQMDLPLAARTVDPLDYFLRAQDEMPLDRKNEIEVLNEDLAKLNPRQARSPRNARSARKVRTPRNNRRSRR
jgi:predicted NAD-dependent protein-ADP-ribosyltransferase YbiA (DUF1768 family)